MSTARLRPASLTLAGAAAVAAYLSFAPIGYLVWKAFAGDHGPTLDHFRDAYAADGLGSMAANSVLFAAGACAIAVLTGTALAFVVTRTDAPLRRVFFAAALIPMVVPGVLYTIAWIFLASPRVGALRDVLPFDAFGMTGMILVEGMHLSPLVFLLMAAVFSSMDPSLEEAALTSGARPLTTLRRVTLPLVRPALYAAVLVVAVRAIESFEVPALLGVPDGTYVFTSRIFKALDGFPVKLDQAAAYSVPLLALTILGVFLYSRLSRRGAGLQAAIGRGGRRPRRLELGRWRVPVTAAAGAYVLFACVAPLAMLAYASTQKSFSTPSWHGLSQASLHNYADMLDGSETARAVLNSLVLAAGTATAVMALMAMVAWILVRGRARHGWALDAVVTLPLALPGLVLGAALLFIYLNSPVPVYGTLWILLIAYFTRFMPYGLRYATSMLSQVGEEMEDAARVSGAGWMQTFRRVTVPLLLPGLVAGWIFVAIASMRELSTSVLLTSPGSEVLPVRMFTLYEGGQFTAVAALGVATTVVIAVMGGLAWRLGSRLGSWET